MKRFARHRAALRAVVFGSMLVILSGTAARAEAPPLVTFDQLLQFVQLGVPEAKLQQLIAAAPTRFVLGQDQLESLRQAGASSQLLALLTGSPADQPAATDVANFVLILDCSGSMRDTLPDGSRKWDASLRAAAQFVQAIPPGRNLCAITYGTDLKRKCQSFDLVRGLLPLTDPDRTELLTAFGRLQPMGHTPIANSLRFAGEQLTSASGLSHIVLITDGLETCHADPVAVAAELVGRFPDLAGIHVVGFCLNAQESAQVARIAAAGRGTYYEAANAEQLCESIRQIEARTIPQAAPQDVNLEGLSPLERMLIAQLEDDDIDARAEAARTLGQRKVHAAVPALRNLLVMAPFGTGLAGDVDRDAAIEAILQLDAEAAGEALSAALTSETRQVRIWAAEAIGQHQVAAAAAAAVERLLAMRDEDLPAHALNGTDEADAIFAALQKVAPQQLEAAVVQLLGGRSPNVKAWAAAAAKRLR